MVTYGVKVTSQSVSPHMESRTKHLFFPAGCKHRAKDAIFLFPQLLYNLLHEAVPLESGLKSKDLKNLGGKLDLQRTARSEAKASVRYQIKGGESSAQSKQGGDACRKTVTLRDERCFHAQDASRK